MSTCNRLDSEALGSPLIMPKNILEEKNVVYKHRPQGVSNFVFEAKNVQGFLSHIQDFEC